MSNEFTQHHFSSLLYGVPRIVDDTNVGLLSNDLMLAYLWESSETLDTVSCFVHIAYGTIPNYEHQGRKAAHFGFRLRNYDVFLADIFAALRHEPVPAEVHEEYPELVEAEWKAAVETVELILRSFHTFGRKDTEYVGTRYPLNSRALTAQLYAASRMVNQDNVTFLSDDILYNAPALKEHIEYGIHNVPYFEEQRLFAGLKIKGKNIPLSSMFTLMGKIPADVLTRYPMLAERSKRADLPPGFLEAYEDEQHKIDAKGKIYPWLWWMVLDFAETILSVFERQLYREANMI